jgi:hypothetical protein
MNRRPVLLGRRALVLVGLIIALLPFSAFSANDTPDTAQSLDASTSSSSSTLFGSSGGAYQYYRFPYQGASAPALVTLTFQPGVNSTGSQGFGFNLYGPNGLNLPGHVTGSVGAQSTAQYTFANPAAMTVLVQIYNYVGGVSVDYTLSVSGLSGGSASAVVAQNNTTPDQSAQVGSINASLGGTIVGTSAGAFQYFIFHYPGGNTPLAVTLNAAPAYTGQGQAYGFNLYRVGAGPGSAPVASGIVTSADTNSETISATVTNRSATTYQLQVFNYWPNTSVTYGITVTGLAGTIIQASGNTDAGHAVVLNSAQSGASESLAGASGGSFDYFLVSYPGNNSSFALSVTYSQTGGAPDQALGFNVYNGSTLVVTTNAADDGTGVQSGVWNYQNASAATFGVQVFNYASGTTVSYTLQQVGAQ